MEDAVKSGEINEPERPAATRGLAEAGENPPARPAAPPESVQGNLAPSSHLATEGDLDALAPEMSPVGDKTSAETQAESIVTVWRAVVGDDTLLRHYVKQAIRDAQSGYGADPQPCADCDGQPEVILLLPDRPQKCINCLLIAAMKRPCAICGQHITEAITRALDEQGKPNTIGTCLQCLMKAAAAQRN